jgi:hypothetical protein
MIFDPPANTLGAIPCRKDPEDIPRYSEAGKGVGYDQASEALVMLPGHQTGTTGVGERAGITAASVSNVTPQEHAIGYVVFP